MLAGYAAQPLELGGGDAACLVWNFLRKGLADVLLLNQPVEVVGMLGRASILHHQAICLHAAFWINDFA